MRIEVIIGNDDPVVYPLNAPKITLGTSESCDIVLNADGISRKHITLFNEGDNFYVIDQGSTNGSYINEERLIPGRKTEFTSFFPLRLGDRVLITLLSDDEYVSGPIELPKAIRDNSGINGREDRSGKTTIIPLSELGKKTEKLVQNKIQRKATKRPVSAIKPKPAPKKSFSLVPFLAISILVSAAVYNLYFMEPEIYDAIPEPQPVVESHEAPKPVVSELISERDLTPKENYSKIFNDMKCATDTEKILCDYFPGARGGMFGVTQIGLTFHVLIDGSKYFEEAMKLVPKAPDNADDEKIKYYEKFVADTAAYLYFIDVIESRFIRKPLPSPETPAAETPEVTEATPAAEIPPVQEAPVADINVPAAPEERPAVDFSGYKEYNLHIALFRKGEDDSFQVGSVIAIKPELISRLKEFVISERIPFIKTMGENALSTTRGKYLVF